MPKHVLVALPLSDAQRSALQASVPEYEFIFAQTETVTLAQVLEADIIMGNVPVELICQNRHLEWFQSNFAGPDTYLVPGVLPEQCLVTNATGAYGLAISEWMLGLWLGLQKDLFLYRDRQTQHKWDAITRQVRPVAGSRVLCVGMGDIGSNFAMRAHALGAAQLVGGQAHHIHAPDLRLTGNLQKALHRVAVQQGAGFSVTQELSRLRHGEDAAGLVVHQHHGHQHCVVPQGARHLFHSDVAGAVRLQVRDLVPLLCQPAARNRTTGPYRPPSGRDATPASTSSPPPWSTAPCWSLADGSSSRGMR